LEISKVLVKAGADVNKSSGVNPTPLWVASRNGHLELVRFLLENKTNVNLTSEEDGSSPLIAASHYNHLEVVQLLVQAGAEINHRDNNGMSALSTAYDQELTPIAKLLEENGARGPGDITPSNPGDHKKRGSELYNSATQKKIEEVKKLISNGADLNWSDSNGRTPLLIAAKEGTVTVLKLLVEAGANVNQASTKGHTALYKAAKYGNLEIVKLLLKYGADSSKKTPKGYTPITIAIERGHQEIVQLLRSLGVSQ